MSEEGYNGWANRETWAVALWINNEQGWQEQVFDALRAMLKTADCGACGVEDCRECFPLYDAANNPLDAQRAGDVVKENVESWITVEGYREMTGEEHLPASLSHVAEDIGSLYRVDWDEIGAAFLTDLGEQS